MAELIFAEELTLTENFLNTCIGNEPNNEIIQFGVVSDQQVNDHTQLSNSNYNSLTWLVIAALMTQHAISRIGIKNFPQIGACGFFVDKYTGQSTILIPVRTNEHKYNPPTLAVSTVTEGISIIITPPKDITYTCYKIIMRNGYYANEYTMYNTTTILPAPTVIGNYEIYAIGYNEDTGIISSWSNIITLSITSGQSNWTPAALIAPMSLADLTDVSIVNLLNAQSIRYNSTTQKWENITL